MIPLRLTLHNFMCYREGVPPVELTSVRLACLTGDNGAGKSALLDAITWSLWGKARVNSDLDLMSLGATEMRVEFEFRLGDQVYRIARRRTRKGAAAVWLDLHAHDPATDTWRSQTGEGVRETQRAITDLLRMEYETFINSAFLLQGRADEFTTKPPARRKEVLAEILGLSLYDNLERRARERFRAHTDDLRALEAEHDRLLAIARQEPAHAAEQARLTEALEALVQALARLAAEHQRLQHQRAELEQRAHHLSTLEAQIGRDEQLLRQVDGWAAGTRRELAALEQLLARREEIEAGADQLVVAQQRRLALDGAVKVQGALMEQRHLIERAIEGARRELVSEQRTLTHRLSELADVVKTLPALQQRRQALARAATEATRLGERSAALQAEERRLHGEAEELKGRNAYLKLEMKKLKERQLQVDGAGATCPLCRRELGPDDKRHIHDDYQREGLALKATYQANQQRIDAALARGGELGEEITRLGFQREKAVLDARDEVRVAAQIEQAGMAQAEQTATQVRLVQVAERLEREDYAAEERAALGRLTAEIAAIGYDEAEHEAAREAERRLSPFAEQRARVRQAALTLPDEQAKLAAHEATARELTEQIARAREAAAALALGLGDLPALRESEQALRTELETRQRARNDAERELGRVQAQLAACRQARVNLEVRAAERARLAEERELYGELVEAFGKKGIQAMIIETVVPEVQDEANAILDRMPGNTMRVEFHTRREKKDGKDGDAIETLDVIIKDEVGARRYEMYSGGEAFRANFAIRVALSKLLARRAGAQLQTLVIDEGFGTQDAKGREGLIEAIRSIEEDFATILVITHLSDIRDEFPTRIDVTKGIDGSLVTVR